MLAAAVWAILDAAGTPLPLIAVGSASQLKRRAVADVSATLFHEETWVVAEVPCDSRVPETPWDADTLRGAENRAREARSARPDAVLAVGLESGLVVRFGETYEEAWACVLGRDDSAVRGYSSGLRVPPTIVHAMNDGAASHAALLRTLDGDPRAGRDTWSLYTANKLSRLAALSECVRNAMVAYAIDGTLNLEEPDR